MKGLFLPLILFALLIAESIATELLPNNILLELYFIPHWILVFSVMITLYYDKEHSYAGIYYGAIFAFISELVYDRFVRCLFTCLWTVFIWRSLV